MSQLNEEEKWYTDEDVETFKFLLDEGLVQLFPESNITYVNRDDLIGLLPHLSEGAISRLLVDLGYGVRSTDEEGNKFWYVQIGGGDYPIKPHRVDGASNEWADGYKTWYWKGEQVTKQHHGLMVSKFGKKDLNEQITKLLDTNKGDMEDIKNLVEDDFFEYKEDGGIKYLILDDVDFLLAMFPAIKHKYELEYLILKSGFGIYKYNPNADDEEWVYDYGNMIGNLKRHRVGGPALTYIGGDVSVGAQHEVKNWYYLGEWVAYQDGDEDIVVKNQELWDEHYANNPEGLNEEIDADTQAEIARLLELKKDFELLIELDAITVHEEGDTKYVDVNELGSLLPDYGYKDYILTLRNKMYGRVVFANIDGTPVEHWDDAMGHPHRTNGPADIDRAGTKRFMINGKNVARQHVGENPVIWHRGLWDEYFADNPEALNEQENIDEDIDAIKWLIEDGLVGTIVEGDITYVDVNDIRGILPHIFVNEIFLLLSKIDGNYGGYKDSLDATRYFHNGEYHRLEGPAISSKRVEPGDAVGEYGSYYINGELAFEKYPDGDIVAWDDDLCAKHFSDKVGLNEQNAPTPEEEAAADEYRAELQQVKDDMQFLIDSEGLVDKIVDGDITYINATELAPMVGRNHNLVGHYLSDFGYGVIRNVVEGCNTWTFKGKKHRTGGPAYECEDGYKTWYIEGREIASKYVDSKINIKNVTAWSEYFAGTGLNEQANKGYNKEEYQILKDEVQWIIDEKLVDLHVESNLTYVDVNDLENVFPETPGFVLYSVIPELGYGEYSQDENAQYWTYNGDLHRVDGAATIYTDGEEEFWVDGVLHGEMEYQDYANPPEELNEEEEEINISTDLLDDIKLLIDENLVEMQVDPDKTYVDLESLNPMVPGHMYLQLIKGLDKLGYGYIDSNNVGGKFYMIDRYDEDAEANVGELHRVHGPAIIHANGQERWFLDDEEYEEADHYQKVKERSLNEELSVDEIRTQNEQIRTDIQWLIDEDLITTYPESNITYVDLNELYGLLPDHNGEVIDTILNDMGYGEYYIDEDDEIGYYINMLRHRIDGPAVTSPTDVKEWYYENHLIADKYATDRLNIYDKTTWNEIYADNYQELNE